MKAIIDTSSLLAVVRYYLPFDQNGTLKNLLIEKFLNGEILVIDRVLEEARYTAKGVIIDKLDFLDNKSKIINTNTLIPTTKFFNLMENQFCNKDVVRLRGISEIEFEQEKNDYLQKADAGILLFALKVKNDNPIIVTEESKSSNDNKIFRKIPENCSHIGIACCTMPELFKNHLELDLASILK